MKITATIIALIVLCVSSTSDIKQLYFLEGTWKVEGDNTYEEWKINNGSLEGSSYTLKAGKKVIAETLSIKASDDHLIYAATVLDQNNGRPVEFTMNKTVSGKFSFENLKHDFPKKIQYTKLNETTLFVEVLGGNDKGFSYKMQKQ